MIIQEIGEVDRDQGQFNNSNSSQIGGVGGSGGIGGYCVDMKNIGLGMYKNK